MFSLLDLAKRRIALLSLAVLCSMLGTFLKLAPLAAIYFMTLEIISGAPSQDRIRNIILLTMLAMALRWVLMVCGSALSHVAAYNILYDLRMDIANRLARLPMGFILKYDSGDLKRVLQEDIERLEMFLGHMLPDVSSAVAMLLAGGVALFVMDPLLALAVFAPLPLALALQSILWKAARPVMEAYFMSAGRLNANIVEFIRAIPVIKTFGRNSISMSRLKSSIDDFQTVVSDFCHKFVPAWVGFLVVINASLLFILPVGGWKLMNGSTDVATFVFFILIGVGLMQNLVEVMAFGNQMRGIMAGFARIQDVMTAPLLETQPVERRPESFDLAFNNVSFAYQEGSPVLQDISFTCKAGQITALVGPSGAGKSTLAQLAVRFWDPDAGSVSIGGVPLGEMSQESLNSLTACVFQDVFLFNDTMRENIRIGRPGASQEEIIEAAKAAQIHDFIMSLPDGYDTMLGERGARLSGGQKQRLSIARALLKDTPVIILDEATAYADPVNERNIHKAIKRLCLGRTVLVIAHRLGSIRDAARIVVMQDGKLEASGTHEELSASCALYRRLWTAWDTERTAGEQPANASGIKGATI